LDRIGQNLPVKKRIGQDWLALKNIL
jgi:hypothetical protein